MPKQAIFSQPTSQRVAVAVFMLSLLATVTGLAYAATLRPKVNVAVAGLALSFTADWRLRDGQTSTHDGVRAIMENDRRPALRAAVQFIPVFAPENREERDDPAAALRVLFPMMAMAPLPEDDTFETRPIGDLEVAYWTGVLRSRVPIFGQAPLSVFALGLVTDGKGNYWSISMRDDNYQHEDPAARVAEHRERFLELIDTLEPHPASEILP
ncbi:MAG: hypothetical protein AAF328_10725 [Planctomycetota bacterium]